MSRERWRRRGERRGKKEGREEGGEGREEGGEKRARERRGGQGEKRSRNKIVLLGDNDLTLESCTVLCPTHMQSLERGQ